MLSIFSSYPCNTGVQGPEAAPDGARHQSSIFFKMYKELNTEVYPKLILLYLAKITNINHNVPQEEDDEIAPEEVL